MKPERLLLFKPVLLSILLTAAAIVVPPALAKSDKDEKCLEQFQVQDKQLIADEARIDDLINLIGFSSQAADSLTSRRQESKVVVDDINTTKALFELQQKTVGKLHLRDIPMDGHTNWTETVYTTP